MTMMILLTRGKTAYVDDEDYERVMEHSWCMHPCGYAKARINKKYVLMHRWLLDAPSNLNVDHINGNKLDNRRSNLRLCTSMDNHANCFVARSPTGFKGVDWSKSHGKWRARLVRNYRTIHLGYFDTPVLAARAYNEAALKYFGPYANLNKVPA